MSMLVSLPINRVAWHGGCLAAALALIAATGCWQEIRYEPRAEPTEAEPQEADATEQDDGSASAEERPAAAPPGDSSNAESSPAAESLGVVAAEGVDDPSALDTDDLFGALAVDESGGGDFPEDVPSSNEAALSAEGAVDATTSVETPTAPSETASAEATPQQRRLAWEAAANWSLAAAMAAKELPADRWQPVRDAADTAAAQLGVTLPPMPIAVEGESIEQAAIESLNGLQAAQVVDAIIQRCGAAAGALAELAIRSNLLLLVYSPQQQEAAAQAVEYRAAAEASLLPADLWRPLAELLESRAEFVDVRGAVFDLHRRTAHVLDVPAVE